MFIFFLLLLVSMLCVIGSWGSRPSVSTGPTSPATGRRRTTSWDYSPTTPGKMASLADQWDRRCVVDPRRFDTDPDHTVEVIIRIPCLFKWIRIPDVLMWIQMPLCIFFGSVSESWFKFDSVKKEFVCSEQLLAKKANSFLIYIQVIRSRTCLAMF